MAHNRVHFSRVQGGQGSDCILGSVLYVVLHNGGGDTLLVLVLILIYESDITISNESGEASWWSPVSSQDTFCHLLSCDRRRLLFIPTGEMFSALAKKKLFLRVQH